MPALHPLASTLLCCAVVAAGGCQEPGTAESEGRNIDAQLVVDEVRSFLGAYNSAIEARDTAALRRMYVDDGRFAWVEDGRLRYASPSAVVAGLDALPSDARAATTYDGLEVLPLSADRAFLSTEFQTEWRQADTAFAFGGVITMLVERGPAGWTIVRGHTSTARDDGW